LIIRIIKHSSSIFSLIHTEFTVLYCCCPIWKVELTSRYNISIIIKIELTILYCQIHFITVDWTSSDPRIIIEITITYIQFTFTHIEVRIFASSIIHHSTTLQLDLTNLQILVNVHDCILHFIITDRKVSQSALTIFHTYEFILIGHIINSIYNYCFKI